MTDLTEGPVLSRIVGFALPLTLADLLQQGYLLVDSIIVGRYVGIDGLAAVGAGQPLFYLMNAMFIGIGTAFTIRLAHLTGAREGTEVRAVARSLTLFTVAWSLGAMLLTVLLARFAFDLIGIHGQLVHQSRQFLDTLALGFPAIFGGAAVSAFLRGFGASRAAMWIQGLGSVVNAALAWFFVAGLHLGVAGAALATVAAATLALAVGGVHLRRAYRLGPRTGEPAVRKELTEALRLGAPLAIQHIGLALGIMVLVWIIAGFGPVCLAAFTVVGRLELFTSLLFLDLSGGLCAFVAQNLGAGRAERIRAGLRQAVLLTVGLTVLVSALVLLGRTPIADLFTADRQARALTVRYLLITYPFFACYTVMVVVHGYLNGARRTAVPLVCTVLAFGLTQVPAAYLLHRPLGIDGVMWAVVLGWSVGLAYTLFSVRHQLRPVPAGAAVDAPAPDPAHPTEQAEEAATWAT
ncbi:MATE family efflux transporter [Kitasatospora sp. NBC_01287]|uniref:MATE family efflux transporter n=1 Tax=Kitasatospora sp. NBC_01287 TaxID=2903573 RepID=UPI002257B111|nr:MATE family efflux transporter [Kitasatospora sp. NBC_01287]MCX4751657.1 MATE family efflux transporter [Kitasatospora sp. NBC_01287]